MNSKVMKKIYLFAHVQLRCGLAHCYSLQSNSY